MNRQIRVLQTDDDAIRQIWSGSQYLGQVIKRDDGRWIAVHSIGESVIMGKASEKLEEAARELAYLAALERWKATALTAAICAAGVVALGVALGLMAFLLSPSLVAAGLVAGVVMLVVFKMGNP